jgi:predicted transcriptional regulator of viral defense system
MKKLIADIDIIKRFAPELKGVFTLADLKTLLTSPHIISFYRRISALEREGVLKRYIRGVYTAEGFDLKYLSYKINPRSYISMECVLAHSLIIGTEPVHEVKAVKVGKKREFTGDQGRIIYMGIGEHLYFGFQKRQDINFAIKEKAFLDTLYFYAKGMKFYFDIYSDIDTKKLDASIINDFLKRYKNPKFITFVRNYINGYTFS